MSDVYKIGVAIALNSNGLGVLGALASSMKNLDKAAIAATGRMNALKTAALGAMGVIAGVGIARGMMDLVKHGDKLIHQQALMREAHISEADIVSGTAKAYQTMMSVRGTGVVENLELLFDLRNRLGTIEQAKLALDSMAKIGVVLSAGTGQSAAKAGDDFARFLELKGALVNPVTHKIDADRLMQAANLGMAIATSTRFKVGPSQLLAFQQQARAAGASLSEEGLINIVPYIQAAGNGHRVGTQLASLQQQTLGGVMTKAGAEFFVKAGVLAQSAVHVGRGGRLTVDREGWKNGEQLRTDTATWIDKTLRDGLVKNFHAITADQQAAAVQSSHLRGTVVGLIVEGIRSAEAFKKDAENVRDARKADAYAIAIRSDPTARMNAFKHSWDNLLTALGSPLVSGAYHLLDQVTGVLTKLAYWASTNPALVEQIGGIAAAFGAILGVGGLLAVGGVALTALGVLAGPLGLAGLAAAIILLHSAFRPDDSGATPGERARAGRDPTGTTPLEQLRRMLPTAAEVGHIFYTVAKALEMALLDFGGVIGKESRTLFNTAVSSIRVGLASVADAIIQWVMAIPGRIAGALGGLVLPTLPTAGQAKGIDEGLRRQQGRTGSGLGMPTDGFGVDGMPILPQYNKPRTLLPNASSNILPPMQPMSYVPPPRAANVQSTPIVFHLDGREVARGVIPHIGREMNAAPSGRTGFDTRLSPRYAGAVFAA